MMSLILAGTMGVSSYFSLESQGFKHNEEIPREFTCKGTNRSPGLSWKGAPKETESFALAVVDPDAPGGEFIHWIVTDIPASFDTLEGGIGHKPIVSDGITQGENSFGRIGFDGPCPPKGKKHRYIFILYALDIKLGLKPGSSYDEFTDAIKKHILAKTSITGLFGVD